ncbi:heparinase II/III family protein [Lederbergia citrea]|uniref:heparinase II/III family protein n=1 Tax=Lederbergia citrea TaxID=2833581 RepID=UPI001BCA0D80|nr:heparinase II/III family protein [Lederbergia citrea]MBS4204785.1 alginate lyase family protein [Lederbergia citrea]
MEKLKIKFNPYNELNLNEAVRLIIHDWKDGETHTDEVIPPGKELELTETDFKQHLYYRYKYQVEKDGKWEDLTRYKHLPERETEEGIKYLYYHHPNSSALIVIFQALASIPGYNYVRTLKDLPVSKLYIKDEYGPDPTKASYYLGENKKFDIATNTSKLIEDIRNYNNLPKRKVICAGSSKGGFASIYQAYLNGYGYVVAGGPQIYLGDYLGKSLGNPKSVLAPIYTFITGNTMADDKKWANNILPNLIKSNYQRVTPQLNIHVGKEEPHYKNHVLPFYEYLQEIGGQNIELDLGDYNDHDELAIHFPGFLSKKVNKILSGISPTETILFKRTEPNSSTLEIVEMIMNNEIFLFKTWKPFKFNGELNWDEDPYKDRTWKFYLHEIRVVSFLVNAYELTKDMKYLKKARWYIESWMSKNPTPNKNVSEWAWSGHGTANRLLNLLYFWTYYKDSDEFDEEFEAQFTELLLEHGLFLEKDENYEDYNHGIFQDQALMELSVLFPEFSQSKGWLRKSVDRLTMRMNKDFSPSGVHKEHSPSYHVLVMKLFMSIKKFMDFYNVTYSNEFKNKFHLMQDYLAIITNKDGTLPLLGDTGLSRALGTLKEDEILSEYWLNKSSKGVKGTPLNRSFYPFPDAGITIYKGKGNKNDVEWVFTSAFHSTVHKHADDLSLLLRHGKTNYFVDSGRYNYKEKDPFRRFFRSVFAHNSIAVDGKSYNLTSSQSGKSLITDYGQTDSYTYVRGQHHLYEGITITRLLLHLKDGPILIHDKIESKEKHKYTQIFNIGKDIAVNSQDNNSLLLQSKLDHTYVELKQANAIKDFTLFEGSTDPIQGWQSFDFNQKHPIKSAHFTIEGNSVEFLTLVNLSSNSTVDSVVVQEESDNHVYKLLKDADEIFNVSLKETHTNHESMINNQLRVDEPVINNIILSNKNDLVPQGTSITVTIDANGDNLTYAWYVYHNGKRIDVKKYSPNMKKLTIKLNQEGKYYLKAYAKNDKGEKVSRNTNIIKVYKVNIAPKEKKSIINLYDNKKVAYEDIEKLKMNFEDPAILSVEKNKVNYDFLIKTNKNSPFLVVLGSGAYNAKEYNPPIFQRHSWAEQLQTNVIFYNDPTLYLGEINLGWGQGTKQDFYLESIADMVKQFAIKMNINNSNILFYGSSAGGFMSLILGGILKGSSVLVNNPQTIVPNYYKSYVQAMYEASYPNINNQQINNNYKERLDITAFYKSIGYMPNIYYLQNAACLHDMENHFNPFLNKVSEFLKQEKSGQFISHLYWDEQSQHNPVGKEDTLSYIKKASELFLNNN